MKKTFFHLTALSLLLSASPWLKASSVTVNNFSFENPVLNPGNYTTGVVDWTSYTGGAGAQYFSTSQFSSASPLPSPALGNQAVYVNTTGGKPNGVLYQDVGALLPNTLYTLTVAVGNRADQGGGQNAGTISLYNGADPSGTQLATSGSVLPAVGTFQDAQVTYHTGPVVSGDLLIALVQSPGSDNSVFDNVRLDATAAPGPFAGVPTYTPNVSPIFAGTPITLSESSTGVSPLSYQWLTDGGSGGALTSISGATATNLAVNTTSFAPGNYNYSVIVTNIYGASTSSVVTLSIIAASAPQLITDITPDPANEGYVGQTMTYSAPTFVGTLPITYQWMVDKGSGPMPILVASNPTAISNVLVISNLQSGDAGIYSVEAQNSVGGPVSSSSSTLTVLPDPAAPASGTYASLILSQNPTAYWRFNETEDPSTGVLPAYDATGHNFDGLYFENTYNGYDDVPGPQPPTFPGFESDNSALFTSLDVTNSWATVPPLNLDTNTVTITMWIDPSGDVAQYSGLLMNRNLTDGAGLGFGNTANASGAYALAYTWNTNSQATYGFNSRLYPISGIWSFVALVIQTNQATLYLYYIDPVTGSPDLYSAVNPVPNGPEAFSGGTTMIGDDQNNISRVFNGSIDEVAVFNAALTPDQVLAQFDKGIGVTGLPPVIENQPQSSVVYTGGTAKFTASSINGSTPLTYQWLWNGNNVTNSVFISGAQTATLTISNAASANEGTYQLLVGNFVNSTYSSNVTLGVVAPVAGSYEAAVLADNPFVFWKLNETNDPSVGNVLAYDYIHGLDGVYQPAAQNGFDGILGPLLPGFPTNITALGTFSGTANCYVSASAGSLETSNLTYAMWINPSGPVQNYVGLLIDRGGAGEGLGFGGSSDGTGMAELGYTWNQNSTWSWNSNLFPPVNQWSFVAMVIEPSQATLYMINSNGVQSAVNPISHDNEEFGVAWHIGDDAQNTSGGRTFPGRIADVAVYLSALSVSQVSALYDAALQIVPPVTLNIVPVGNGQVTLSWSQGTLLQSTNIAGPWSTNTAVSPYTVPATNSSLFFRVGVQ